MNLLCYLLPYLTLPTTLVVVVSVSMEMSHVWTVVMEKCKPSFLHNKCFVLVSVVVLFWVAVGSY